MKRLEIYLGLIALAISVFACKKDDTDATPPQKPENIEEAITHIFKPMVDGDTAVGISVGIIDNGDIKTFFFGETELGNAQQPDANTIYEIGSISKTMTATILAQMVLNGDIKLDDPVENYLTEVDNFPNFNGNKITFRHLADHTSALPNIPDNYDKNGFDESNPFKVYSSELLYEFLKDYQLSRTPGSVQEYSNVAFGLLGHVLAKIKNTSFEALLEQHIFETLELDHTYTQIPENESNVAVPYDGNFKPVPMWDFSDATLGAGGVKSSLNDMMQYLKANMGIYNSSLDDAISLAHTTSHELNYPFNLGLAWVKIVNQNDGTRLVWHNGGTAGTVAFMGFVKELDLGVVVLYNTEINERIKKEGTLELLKGVQVIQAMKQF